MSGAESGGEGGLPGRLCELIRLHKADILDVWEERVRALPIARHLSTPALRDHLPQLLDRLASVAETTHTGGSVSLSTLPDVHALERLDEGFDVRAVAAEFTLLRAVIFEAWAREGGSMVRTAEVMRLDAAIDEAVATAVSRFAAARERTLQGLDRVSAAALGSGDIDTFLPKLIEVLQESTQAVDAVVILLREEEHLRVRAATGLDLGGEGFTSKMGEYFGGQIAVTRTPRLLKVASEQLAYVESEAIRRNKVKVVYGVPLLQEGEVLGVALMGSRTAHDFSDADKQLFRAMVHRATSLIAQAQLITLEKQARAEAQRRVTELNTVIQAIPNAVLVGDQNGIHLANVGALRLSGFSSLEALQRDVGELGAQLQIRHAGTGEPIPPSNQTFARALRGEASDYEAIIRNQLTGEDRYVRAVGAPIRLEDGRTEAVAVVSDITSRRRMEDELRDQEERLRLALASGSLGMWDYDPVTRNFHCDERFKANLGLPPDAPVDFEIGYRIVHPEDRERTHRAALRAMDPAGGGMYRDEYRICRYDDGAERWLHVLGRCLFDELGKPVRFVGTCLDFTDRKRAQEELARTAQFRDQFISVLGHDLRNPLWSIQGSVDLMLKRDALQPGQHAGLLRILRSTHRMGRMISDVLDFTRGRLGGGFPIKPQRANLHELSRGVVEELSVAYPDRDLDYEARGDGWGEWDPDRVAQAISNLVGNALQHGATDAPVTVRLCDQGAGVLLEVTNRGTPIPPELLPDIFEPFRGTEVASARTGQKSIGLGLWIVHAIVRAHAGEVTVRSSAEEGTIFSTWWPRRPPANELVNG